MPRRSPTASSRPTPPAPRGVRGHVPMLLARCAEEHVSQGRGFVPSEAALDDAGDSWPTRTRCMTVSGMIPAAISIKVPSVRVPRAVGHNPGAASGLPIVPPYRSSSIFLLGHDRAGDWQHVATPHAQGHEGIRHAVNPDGRTMGDVTPLYPTTVHGARLYMGDVAGRCQGRIGLGHRTLALPQPR